MNQHQSAPDLLKKREVTALLRVSLRTLDDWISRQIIPFIKVGGAVRFLRSDVDALIQKHRVARIVREQEGSLK
jgi:excisionase family DNA binding protein